MNRIILGDCLERLKELPDNSIDALITDPPAGISFMGKKWDGDRTGMIEWVNWLSAILSEAYRVMKPGACGAVWSIPRTCGWTQLAIELAGFRIWDSIAILQGSGFPKAQDIGKMIDRELGRDGDRLVVGATLHINHAERGDKNIDEQIHGASSIYGSSINGKSLITAPATPEAEHWNGWKTLALKPSHENWFCIQKPISEQNTARNILKWGVGGVNIEACRIETDDNEPNARKSKTKLGKDQTFFSGLIGTGNGWAGTSGRYPANTILIHSPDCTTDRCSGSCPVEILGQQSGECKSGGGNKRSQFAIWGKATTGVDDVRTPSTGTAARYFLQLPHDPDTFKYFTKASRRDRTVDGAVNNVHPTVKSTALMEYFCKLLCPPNGIVLDPFGGSGSTALGAIKAGMQYCLIEQDAEYVAIAQARIEALTKVISRSGSVDQIYEVSWAPKELEPDLFRKEREQTGQYSIFDLEAL